MQRRVSIPWDMVKITKSEEGLKFWMPEDQGLYVMWVKQQVIRCFKENDGLMSPIEISKITEIEPIDVKAIIDMMEITGEIENTTKRDPNIFRWAFAFSKYEDEK